MFSDHVGGGDRDPRGTPAYVAASDESALRFEELQSELGEGPCVEAYRRGEAVAVPDLREETGSRSSRPGPRRRAYRGVHVPAPPRAEQLGALDLYRDTPGPLDADRHGRRANPGRCRRRLPDQRPGPSRSRERYPIFLVSALHDPLTGLPNRLLLFERLDHAVFEAADRHTGRGAVPRPRPVQAGQRHVRPPCRRRAAGRGRHRLTASLRAGDTLARFSGDEFVFLCEDLGPRRNRCDRRPVVRAIEEALRPVRHPHGDDCQCRHRLLESRRPASTNSSRTPTSHVPGQSKGGDRHRVIDLRERHLPPKRSTSNETFGEPSPEATPDRLPADRRLRRAHHRR